MTSTDDVRSLDLRGRDGLRLRADEFGDPDDPPVVLLHGGGQTRYAWGSTARVLAERGLARLPRRPARPRRERLARRRRLRTRGLRRRRVRDRPRAAGAAGARGRVARRHRVDGRDRDHTDEPIARGLVLVDVAPKIEQDGAMRIGAFMSEHLEDGFGSLDEVADAVAAYNPHRPRPTDLSGLKKNVRQREDGRWVWHWDPRFMSGKLGSRDETRAVARARRDGCRTRRATSPSRRCWCAAG